MTQPATSAAMRRLRSRCGDESGFTLVEMLVVIAIIGMIMGLIGPRVLSSLNESRVKTARIQIQSFSSALDLFYLDTGRYPTTSEGLTALVRPASTIAGWAGPYLKGGSVPSDPWSHAYVYRSPGQHVPYEILSYGSDGQEGGTDLAADISSSVTVGVR
ncbi:type II secretion system major pseudopilin GspG [Bradyrhizobium sp. HKCCYLRH3099]|uniref:type II secretion system major pseudopilin GspG n=1 Tax=unclassified Bradyrhizobium TaxID=2631580 RepID=UPI003EC14340